MVGGSASAASREDGHLVSFIVTLLMMILVNAFVIWSLKKRQKFPNCRKYGPLIFTLFALPLVMGDLVRHLLCDHNLWSDCGMYGNGNAENLSNLSTVGWIFTFGMTYSGFACLFVGILWNANIVQKLRQLKQKWRVLRGQMAAANATTA